MSDMAFHDGERKVQALAGETAIANRNVAMLSDTVIGGARPFIAKQSMAVLASTDAEGAMWASVVFGEPGFLHTHDGRSITIDVAREDRDAADPIWHNMTAGADVGMLFIELSSRRRYRVNGTVLRIDARGAEVAIHEAYPNCPKYIQRRQLHQLEEPRRPAREVAEGTVLRGGVTDIVARADTLFVASRHAEAGADASHRGGRPGFVKLVDERTLRIPDYPGNSMFNTLGNIEADGRAGICILDFNGGQVLQLTGTAAVLTDQDDPRGETGGTRRFWEFTVNRWILRALPCTMEWQYVDASPFNPVA
ncbi:pyridoxamine 5'-phosphate oxidase family protein [Pseudoduganella lutea]|uniref:Pyridoxamine 5'-phosphate oxidase n=1 Tax=Pseudoduganella lutea TaxID=321985 RepID=A0A4P6KWZ0_9BURK|nr:pyridoxamine 5'-phosphate oxidase family protein [Pseudoduganella lutea]QBE62728.1 pyridoxamine 5'-phosphate oxidase [Pseudoduganella lutea]